MHESATVSVQEEDAGRPLVIRIAGEIDLSNAALVAQKIKEVEGSSANVLLDLEKLQFMDSTGLGVVVNLGKRVKERGGELAIVIAKPSIRKLFSITAFDKRFRIFDSAADAQAAGLI